MKKTKQGSNPVAMIALVNRAVTIAVAKFSRPRPPFSGRSQLFELGKVRRLSSAKAEKELGWSFRPVEETIIDTATTLDVGALS